MKSKTTTEPAAATKKPRKPRATTKTKPASTAPTPAPDAVAPEDPKDAPAPDTPPDSAVTLEALAERYLQAMEQAGKSRGTVFSYSMDLALALKQLGPATPLAKLTAGNVAGFFESDAVTKTRSGKPKAKPTIDKTRRVLRLALTWAAEQKIIAEAPLPPKQKRAKKEMPAA